MNEKMRNKIIKNIEAMKGKILPIEGYIVTMKEGVYFAVLGNRPPKVFDYKDRPLDMDMVFKISDAPLLKPGPVDDCFKLKTGYLEDK